MPTCEKHKTVFKHECSECLHERSREKFAEQKASEKAEKTLKKAKLKQMQPKKPISKNPKDWSNTFLCSDGTKVTQAEINERRAAAYEKYDRLMNSSDICEGCGGKATNHAHIIPQARCKKLGKSELIWDMLNFFKACNACNLAIENPNGKDWKSLKNINKCLLVIMGKDPELFTKFELSAVNQEREPHKI